MIVHKRFVPKELAESCLAREEAAAVAYCRRKYPEAIHRVGCYCCYGDGPDLDINYVWQEDGSCIIECDIDFDFSLEDYAAD